MALIYDSSHSGQEIDAAVDAVQTTIPSQLATIGSKIDDLDSQLNGDVDEISYLDHLTLAGYVGSSGKVNTTGDYLHTDAIAIDNTWTQITAKVPATTNFAGIVFSKSSELPTSSTTAASRVVAVYTGSGSNAGANEVVTVSSTQIADAISAGALYVYIGCYANNDYQFDVTVTTSSGLAADVEMLKTAVTQNTSDIEDLQSDFQTASNNITTLSEQVAEFSDIIEGKYATTSHVNEITNIGYVTSSGTVKSNQTSYKYTNPIAIDSTCTEIKAKVVGSSSSSGIIFTNNATIPASSAQAATRIVAIYKATGSSITSNELVTIDADTIASAISAGARYVYISCYGNDDYQFDIKKLTEKGIEERVADLEESIGTMPSDVAELKSITTQLDADVAELWNFLGYDFDQSGYYNPSGTFVSNDSFRCTRMIPLANVSKFTISYANNGSGWKSAVFLQSDGTVSNITPTMSWTNYTRHTLSSSDFPSDGAYVVFNTMKNTAELAYVIKDDEYSVKRRIKQVIPWEQKNCVCYGDSITAQGNDGESGYVGYLNREIMFSNIYGRGVGGQTFTWNDLCWYTQVGTNGAYLERHLYDSQGNILTSVISSSYTEEQKSYIESALGVSIEVHRGCFCSWDRIKTMIPSDKREGIDLIILMGGTNDCASDKSIDSIIPTWSPDNTTDLDWSADTTYYNGGDYDVTTFSGAVMSTIMKMTIWCPNAVIVVATPLGRYSTTTMAQYVNGINLTTKDYADKEKVLANYLGIPYIDVNGETGINAFNYNTYIADGIHPNAKGQRLMAKVIVGVLRRVLARLY